MCVFSNEINALMQYNKTNVVIAGSCALELHGLTLGWEPQDLDIVLFDPTPAQLLEVVNKYDQCADYEAEKTLEANNALPRSYKLKKESQELNIIIAYDEHAPADLMWYMFGGLMYKVNSIRNIIDAKLSYSVGRKKSYLRAKDMVHLNKLKNLNFNVK